MQNKMSNFNFTLRFGKGGLDIDMPLRIPALHFITCYGLAHQKGKQKRIFTNPSVR